MTFLRWIAVFVLLSLPHASVSTAKDATMQEIEQAKEEIWVLEQEIYSARSQGDLGPYFDNAATGYLAPLPTRGWAPLGAEAFERARNSLKGLDGEKLSMEFKGFTLRGDTAVIYYINHRTALPTGEAVNQWYEVMHIWVRDGDSSWKLLASMPREIEDQSKVATED